MTALKRAALLSAALLSAAPASATPANAAPPPERWLWVQGAHTPSGDGWCAEALREAQSALAQRLGEQLNAALTFDGQTLTCEDAECASKRRDLSGARVALRTSSECRSGALTLSAELSPQGSAPLTYTHKAALRAPQDAGEPEARAGARALGGRLGRKLALLVIKGPLPSPAPPPPTALRLSALTGAHLALTPHGGGAGLALRAELSRQPPRSSLAWLLSLSHKSAMGDTLSEAAVNISAGARLVPSDLGLSPLFGLDLGLSSATRSALSATAVPLSTLTAQFMSIRTTEALLLTGSLEAGLTWRSPRLSLLALLRVEPTLATLSETQGLYGELEGAWSLLAGVSW